MISPSKKPETSQQSKRVQKQIQKQEAPKEKKIGDAKQNAPAILTFKSPESSVVIESPVSKYQKLLLDSDEKIAQIKNPSVMSDSKVSAK